MPRALTEQERLAQRQRLLERGKDAVLSCGARKVSVDDVAKAAGLAKGTFYQHFESKEKYLYALIEKMHHETFAQAEKIIQGGALGGGSPRENARGFMQKLFTMPEMAFFIQNEPDISAALGAVTDRERQSFKEIEKSLFAGILRLFGIDVSVVKPGVVHNYVHALFLMRSSEYMTAEDLPETMNLVLDSLISYVFGGAV